MGYAMSTIQLEQLFNEGLKATMVTGEMSPRAVSVLYDFIITDERTACVCDVFCPTELNDVHYFRGFTVLELGQTAEDTTSDFPLDAHRSAEIEHWGLVDCAGQAVRIYFCQEPASKSKNKKIERANTHDAWFAIQLLN